MLDIERSMREDRDMKSTELPTNMTGAEIEAWKALTAGSNALMGSHIADRNYHESVSVR